MQCPDCGYFGNDKSCPLCFSAGGIHFIGPLPAPKSREPFPPAYWVLIATAALIVCMIAGGVTYRHMNAAGSMDSVPLPTPTPVTAVSNSAMDAISDFFIMLYYVCIATPCVIGLLVGAAMLKQNWDTLSDNERMARGAGCAILVVFGVLVPLSFSCPALYAFLVSFAPLLLLLPVAGWIYYIFAVTRLGQQLDQDSDDIHTIAQNSRHDGF